MLISKFASLTKPHVIEEIEIDWDGVADWFTQKPATEFKGKTKHGGWSPAKFNPKERCLENIVEVTALVLDYDKGASWEAVREAWKDYKCVIYTTRSHGDPEKPGDRLRVILQLQRAVNAEEYARLWEWAARRSPSPLDPQCKDASRFWYAPCTPPGGWRSEAIGGVLSVEIPERRAGAQATPAACAEGIERRAKAYLDKLPPAVSGESGHNTLWNAVAHMLVGFSLDPVVARRMIDEYSKRCVPPWSEREIDHKMKSVAERCNRTPGYLLRERVQYVPPISTDDKQSVDWKNSLILNAERKPKKCVTNISVIISLHPEYWGRWSYDESAHIPCLDGKRLTPDDVLGIREFIEKTLWFTPAREDVETAIIRESGKRKFHPVRDYLRSIDWDGVSRLSTMARDYLGTESPLHAVMVRKWMIGAVQRVLQPGCKLDTALMITGRQGAGKSSAFAVLGGAWHADTFVDISNKDSFSQIHAAWIYELSELENVVTGRAESRLKAWITSTHDTFRAPYARVAERRARSMVLCGTTNRTQFLTDDTGSRRFWIVPMACDLDRKALEEARDQLWAEAVCAAELGESHWLDREQEIELEKGNEKHAEEDAWAEPIRRYLAVNNLFETCTSDLLKHALDVEVGRHDLGSATRVGKVIKRLGGWKKLHLTNPARWVYRRID